MLAPQSVRAHPPFMSKSSITGTINNAKEDADHQHFDQIKNNLTDANKSSEKIVLDFKTFQCATPSSVRILSQKKSWSTISCSEPVHLPTEKRREEHARKDKLGCHLLISSLPTSSQSCSLSHRKIRSLQLAQLSNNNSLHFHLQVLRLDLFLYNLLLQRFDLIAKAV